MLRALMAIGVGVALVCASPVVWAQDDDDDLLGELGSDDEGGDIFEEPAEKPEEAPVDETPAEPVPDEAPPPDESTAPPTETLEAAPAEPPAPPPEEESGADDVDPRLMDRVKAVPRKPVIKKMRGEVTPMFGVSLNDAYYQHLAVGGTALFYPHDNFAFGVSGLYLFTHSKTDNVAAVRQGQTSVPAIFELPDLLASVDFYWVPIYGKISLFDKAIVHFDLYLLNGFGFADAGERTPLVVVPGIGQRFVINDWLALRLEMRDYIFNDNQVVIDQERSDIQNYLMFQAGLSIFVPPSFEYSGF